MEVPNDAKIFMALKKKERLLITLIKIITIYIPINAETNMTEVEVEFDAPEDRILTIYNAMKNSNKDLHVAYESLAPLVALRDGEQIYTGERNDVFGAREEVDESIKDVVDYLLEKQPPLTDDEKAAELAEREDY